MYVSMSLQAWIATAQAVHSSSDNLEVGGAVLYRTEVRAIKFMKPNGGLFSPEPRCRMTKEKNV